MLLPTTDRGGALQKLAGFVEAFALRAGPAASATD
jgi:hypothetical protein